MARSVAPVPQMASLPHPGSAADNGKPAPKWKVEQITPATFRWTAPVRPELHHRSDAVPDLRDEPAALGHAGC